MSRVTWNYRIIFHDADNKNDAWYGLHEVYYDKNGEVEGWTENEVGFICNEYEGAGGILKSLEMAMADAIKRPVLVVRDEDTEREQWSEARNGLSGVDQEGRPGGTGYGGGRF